MQNIKIRAGDAQTWQPPIRPMPVIPAGDSETEALLSARAELAARYAEQSERARTRLDLIRSAPTTIEALRRVYADAE